MLKTFCVVGVLAVGMVACSKKEPPPAPVTVTTASPMASASASPTLTSAALPFEGEIVMNVKDESAQKLPPSITYDVKGDKVRYVPQSSSVRAIDDGVAKTAYVIDDTQKAYKQLDTKPAANAKAPDAKVTKSGKSEKIAGMDCEDWTVEGGNEKVDVCAAKNVAFFNLARDAKDSAAEPAWATAMTKEKAFPLRFVAHDMKGNELFRAEATTVTRKKLEDSLFALPSGFKSGSSVDAKSASLP